MGEIGTPSLWTFWKKSCRYRNHWPRGRHRVSLWWKRQHKNTDTNPCQTVLRASQNQASTLSIQESPAAALNLSSGNAGSCCKGWYPCFCLMVMLFGICRIRSDFLGPWESGREIRNLYTGTRGFPICQSCIPAGIFAIYMTDRSRILPWSFRISFSIHLYCISTPFSQPSLKILLWCADSTIRILSFLGKHWGTLK